MLILLLIIAIALGIFYGILQLGLSGVVTFLLVCIEMILVSQLLIRRYKASSEMGLILLKSKEGLRLIERLARKERVFNFLADVGSSVSYGLLSAVVLRRRASASNLIIGLAVLAFLSFFVGPNALVFLFEILKVGSADSSASLLSESPTLGFTIFSVLLLVGGLFLFILAGIVLYGAVVLSALVKTFFLGVDVISTTQPGGTFLLPGVNLPLFEGIIAITIVMIVHEGAHAILARVAKVPLLSSGLVFFGILPVGAFVEPDEKKLARVEAGRQTRVLVAGSASNLFTSCIFFLVFAAATVAINDLDLMQGAYAAPVRFVYITLGLTFALNFVVGAINLLPLPLFDGYRVIDVNIRNKAIVKAITYVTLFFFILNFLPWLFHG